MILATDAARPLASRAEGPSRPHGAAAPHPNADQPSACARERRTAMPIALERLGTSAKARRGDRPIAFRFSMPWPTPQSPPVGRGRSIGCPMTYSPSRREGARGWAIQVRPSVCSSTDILYAMGIDLAVPGCRIRLVELLDPDEADTRFATARWVRNASTSAAPMSRGCRLLSCNMNRRIQPT
jgi:hypothetical protein